MSARPAASARPPPTRPRPPPRAQRSAPCGGASGAPERWGSARSTLRHYRGERVACRAKSLLGGRFPSGAAHANEPSMSTRIDRRFATLSAEKRAALVTFVMAGDPDAETSLAIVKALPKAGADVIEIGMPFTDPMADGPAIQAAGLRALSGGQTLRKTLGLVSAFRAGDADTPIVLMGYYNPIYVYGVEAFLVDAGEAGVDGLI